MSTIEAVVKRHSVLTYFALVFIISWGGGLLLLGPGRFPPRGQDFANLGALFYVAILAGPCLAGILLTGIVDGRLGLHDLLTRLRRWRGGAKWYAVAFLPALGMAAAALLLSVVSSNFRPAILSADDKASIVIGALVPALMVGLFEEIGWTGFAVPHLRSRHSVIATGVGVGLVWGAWHFPLFWEGDSFSATLPFVILLTRLFSWLPPLRVLLVWVHDHTQSLPVVMMMHALVSFVSIALAPTNLTGARLLTSLFVSAGTMWLLLAVIGAASSWRLSAQLADTSPAIR